MDVAEKMTSSVLGLRTCSAQNCLQSAHSRELCKHCKLRVKLCKARSACCARNSCAVRMRSQNRWCHFLGNAHLLLHANFHRPPTLLTTTFRLKRDKLIRYPSHPFWTAILFFLMALMRVIRKFDVSKMFFIHVWYPLYFSFCSSFSKNGRNCGSKGQFWTKS